jgi:hypothetical protein
MSQKAGSTKEGDMSLKKTQFIAVIAFLVCCGTLFAIMQGSNRSNLRLTEAIPSAAHNLFDVTVEEEAPLVTEHLPVATWPAALATHPAVDVTFAEPPPGNFVPGAHPVYAVGMIGDGPWGLLCEMKERPYDLWWSCTVSVPNGSQVQFRTVW